MHDGVQLFQFDGVGKNDFGEGVAINVVVAVQYGTSEYTHNFMMRWIAGFDECVSDGIGVEDGEAHLS